MRMGAYESSGGDDSCHRWRECLKDEQHSAQECSDSLEKTAREVSWIRVSTDRGEVKQPFAKPT
jgi:hypothetical protein